ncbi:uncharacterized protein LOC134949973 [Pseudophryne corroboree]|uniref:uncharacterized protein LOC134949973 n=1 Tax=Pseudophryne corroboree TaxID=495146 RepID=UPI003081C1D0
MSHDRRYLEATLELLQPPGAASCESVPDYGPCMGDTGDFCPRGIDCSCKDERAFCSCPYYKGPNTDYWYMGSKCDYLWSTWDLVIIAVLPAVALAFIVAVSAQIIHCYKTTSKSKTTKEPESQSERQEMNSHYNRAFVSEAPAHSPFEDITPNDRFTQVPRKMQVDPGRVNHLHHFPSNLDLSEEQGDRFLQDIQKQSGSVLYYAARYFTAS